LIVHNCYVIEPPEDNIESIFDCAKKLARTYSYGGGCGVDISRLAPAGSKVNNAARETTGSVSFMDLYSLTTELIGQNGRRGALMISLDCTHPDLEHFIDIKSDLSKVTKANISIRVSDAFMNAVKSDDDWTLKFKRPETGEEIVKVIKARDLFKKMCFNNWDIAEPGILAWDRITGYNLLSEDDNFEFAGVNPCAKLLWLM
jgi:ribonucleoside-diphosphate reductase alpha chain